MIIDYSKYRMTFDIHTHTTYSHGTIRPHGKGTIEENVRAAIAKGLTSIAISDHGPGHLFYGMRRDDVPEMRAEIQRLQALYPQIRIHLSVEANIIGKEPNFLDVKPDEAGQYDFLLAGYHFGTLHAHMLGNFRDAHRLTIPPEKERLLRDNTEMTVSAVLRNDLKVLTHPGDKGRFDMALIAQACARKGTWMEISTWHDHMTVEEIKIAKKEDVLFIISSDAHTPDRVGSFEGGLQRAFDAGLDLSQIVNVELR